MRAIVLIFLLVLLGGCANIHTRVSVFHELQTSVANSTYAFVPTKEQQSSLEYKSYEDLVSYELNQQGMIETPFAKAEYAIFLTYGIDNGQQVVSSYPIFGQTGGGTAYSSGTVSTYGGTASYSGSTYKTPTYGVVGSGVSSETLFTRYLYIDIIDIDMSQANNGKPYKVYEAKALSSGGSGQLAPVMPAMIRSVFEYFPGKSGSSRMSIQMTQ